MDYLQPPWTETEYSQLYSLSLRHDGFPVLRFLSITLPFHRAAKFISQGHHFDALTCFEAQSPYSIVERDEYGAILSALSTFCSGLESITLSTAEPRENVAEHHAITYRELSTIIRLAALQSDGIRQTMPLQLVAEDVIAIARALPNLSDLCLNPAPDVAAASTLVVSVLSPLRDLCPNLISLRLYLNAANEHIPPPPSIEEELQQAVPEKVGFVSLRKLTVWFSSLASPVPLAVYLSSILPPGCVLISGSYGELRPEEPGPTAYSYVQASASPWDANWSIASRPRCSLSLTLTGLSMVTIDLASFLFFIYIGTAHINMMPATASCAQAL